MQFLILIAYLALIAFVVYDIWTSNNKLDDTQKLIWTLAAIFAGFVTIIIYYWVFKREK